LASSEYIKASNYLKGNFLQFKSLLQGYPVFMVLYDQE
jgi:hypothetical protein